MRYVSSLKSAKRTGGRVIRRGKDILVVNPANKREKVKQRVKNRRRGY